MPPANASVANVRTVPLPSDNSDGDKKYWPDDPMQTIKPQDFYYHEVLAKLCNDLLPAGTSAPVRFDRMPVGYATYVKTRRDSKHTDRYLYGHPRGKFDSPNKFAVHFRWLMGGQKGQCACVNCIKSSKASAPKAHKTPKAAKMKSSTYQAVARSSIEQVKNAQKYVDLIYRQFQAKQQPVPLDFTGGEPEGWEYRIFNQAEEYNTPILEAHSFEPRENEIVLFYTENLGLYFEDETQAIGQLLEDGEHGLIPQWQAGRIIRTPAQGKLSTDDLKYWKTDLKHGSKLFAVEVIPLFSTSLPMTIHNLPLMNFRPFSMVAELLHGRPQIEWDPNILHSSVMSTSLGLVEPCAVWPLLDDPQDESFDDEMKREESIHLLFQCRQMWLGPEKIVQGDVVRLIPETNINDGIKTALLVSSLGYRMLHLENANPDCDAYLMGRHMTTEKPSANARPFVAASATYRDLESRGFPKCMRGYNWYDVNGVRDDTYSISPARVLGRCYEKVAMQIMVWAGDMDIGLKGVIAMRKWARKNTGLVDWVWAAPKDEKGMLFTLDDRIEIGSDSKNTHSVSDVKTKGINTQNGHASYSEHDKSKAVSETASESERFNKMSIVSDHDENDDDEAGSFMLEEMNRSEQGSGLGSREASEDETPDEGQRRHKRMRRE